VQELFPASQVVPNNFLSALFDTNLEIANNKYKHCHYPSHMDTLGYIFEVSKGGIVRGHTWNDLHYLDDILHGYSTKYKLYSKLKTEGSPISYKNIHRRVERLLQNQLIKEITISGGYKHGARNFELTERGLTYLISEIGIPSDLPQFISVYKDSILFKTFVFNAFELKTVKNATYSLLRLLQNYLNECCLLVVSMLEGPAYSQGMESGNHLVLELDDISTSSDLLELRLYLNWQIRSFLIKVCILKDEFIDWRESMLPSLDTRFPTQGKIKCEANDREETRYLLSNDRKFMRAVRELNTDFIQGYDKLSKVVNKQAYKN
jgi:hypothetical protein